MTSIPSGRQVASRLAAFLAARTEAGGVPAPLLRYVCRWDQRRRCDSKLQSLTPFSAPMSVKPETFADQMGRK